MKIKKLTVSNFRSFKEPQTIEFAPVTLLVGPNSVGKSTVLMALFYVQHILAKGQCNPHRIEAFSDRFIGGFKNLVHQRDVNSSIVIRIDYEKGDQIGSTYAFIADIFGDAIDLPVGSPSTEVKQVAVELEISWSDPENTAYVSRYSLWLNDQFIAEVTSDKGLKQPLLTRMNYLHPLLLPENHNEWLEECFDDGVDIHQSLKDTAFQVKDIYIPTDREIAKGADWPTEDPEWPCFTEKAYVSEFHELMNESRFTYTQLSDASLLKMIAGVKLIHVPVSIDGWAGALPKLGKPLSMSLSPNDEQTSEAINEILSDLLVAPLDDLLSLLNDSLCIGPLREIPDRTYQVNPYPSSKDWHKGLAAWDILARSQQPFLKSVHEWISDERKLGLGYEIALKVNKHFAELKSLSVETSYEQIDQELTSRIAALGSNNGSRVQFDESLTESCYVLLDKKSHIEVSPSDIGVGVSQLMPVVVAALHTRKGVVAIEQPELHVHPKVQTGIGDLFTQVNTGATFLIETHSEHLILRLLRRVRETANKSLPDGYNPVNPEDISVVHLTSTDNGAHAQRFVVTSDGDFELDWPDGFFEERDEELF